MTRVLLSFAAGGMVFGSLGALIGLYHAPACAQREIRRVQQYAFGAVTALRSCRRNRDVWMARAIKAERELDEAKQLRAIEVATWGQS
jgi:hypothetical protein